MQDAAAFVRSGLLISFLVCLPTGNACAGDGFTPDRCEIVPLPGRQVSFRIDGIEKTRWHFGAEYPRPFFYPFNGPSGASLTRMGHPGAQNHDHHRSVWFAHHKVNGLNFWGDTGDTQIRQKHWLAYNDGADEAIMASAAGWYDKEGREVMEQQLVAALLPLDRDEHALELQITMRPPKADQVVDLGRTNFGFLAVRVAKSISAHFGGGQLSDSEGRTGEPEIFGKQAQWMDYSGPVAIGKGKSRKTVVEGITYFDHPDNPRYPTWWHVRQDGWMGASFGMHEPLTIKSDAPLVLRYLLHAHGGPYDVGRAKSIQGAFAARPGFIVEKSSKPHRQFEVHRRSNDD